MRPRIIILCIVVALAAWWAALLVAVSIPGSPFDAMLSVIDRLRNPRTDPAAFDEFLVLGKQTKMIAAILFPLIAGVAVAILSRSRVRLTWREALVVVTVFSGFLFVWSGGIASFGLADLASIVIFILAVAFGIPRQRTATAV